MQAKENVSDESRQLRRTMRDLVALSMLPAVWTGSGPGDIAQSLAEVLLNTLSLDLIYIHLQGHAGEDVVEVARSRQQPDVQTQGIAQALGPSLKADVSGLPVSIPNPVGGGNLRIAITRFGYTGDCGVLVAGSQRSDFPTEAERLLLGVGANQTAIVIQRKRAERSLNEQREWLHVTLASIGDAVLTTDTLGRVTFLNAVAQSLTGWAQDEAAGRPLEEVFPIINEQSRQPVENPVKKVLAEGNIIGLANHTVLIAKDGTDRPIDDSAAPIRNAQGEIAGVVLVFRDITERRQVEMAQAEHNRLTELRAETSAALAVSQTLRAALQRCTEALVKHLNVAFARIWTLNETEDVLELQASAGLYTHLDGPHSRIKVGELKIGRIAHNRQPHLTNAVPDDPNISDHAWAKQEGMVAFAGYPLLVEGQCVGVLAMFARRPLTEGVLTDLTPLADGIAQCVQRKLAEEALHAEREFLRVTLASIGDAVITTDTQGHVTFLNGVAQTLTGWTQQDAEGIPLERVFHVVNEQTRQPVENLALRVMREGQIVGLANHTVLIAREGTQHPIDDSAAPIRGADGEVVGVVLVFRDVTERRRAEETLRQSHARFVALFDAAPVGVVLVDAEMRIRQVNPKARPVFGAIEGLIGSNFVEVIHILWAPKVADEVVALFRRTLDTGNPYFNPEFSEERHDSKVREYYDWQIHRIPLLDGQFGVVCYFSDISKHVVARLALAKSEEHLRFMAESMPQKIFTAKPNGDVDYFNPQWTEFTGLSFEQIRDWGWTQFIHPDDMAENVQVWKHSIDTGEPFQFEHRFRRADGEYRWHFSRALPMRDAVGGIVRWIGSNTEVHDLKEAQEALRENERRLRAEVLAMNRLHESSTRLLSAPNLHAALEEILDAAMTVQAADMGMVQLYNAKTQALELVTQRGFQEDFLDSYRRVTVETDSVCGRALRSGERVIVEDVDRSIADAAGFRAAQSTPLRSSNGELLGMLSTHYRRPYRPSERDLRLLDLYARQAGDFIERIRAEEGLKDADRRKDEFLATLAHELRNPLAPLRNALQIMKMSGDGRAAAQVRDMMERQVQQMVRLVDDLLDMSRITKGKIELRKERLALATVVQSAQETSRPLIEAARHELTITLPSEPLLVNGDLTRLAQVLSNLLNNAAKYTPEGGHIRLTVERDGGEAVMRIRDNGTGIPADMLPKIWEMFTQVDRTLERAQGGLGIGLTLVRRLVEMHGGTVEAFSEGTGRGSTFTVRLPLAQVEPGRQQVEGQQGEGEQAPVSERRRILVVDDNVDSAQSLALLLQLTGNEVRTAHDGPSALEVAAAFVPDVVLLDIGLPGMNGLDVARRMREMPRLRDTVLIAQTGWGQQEDRRRTKEAGFNAHLVKPVDLAALQAVLATLETKS